MVTSQEYEIAKERYTADAYDIEACKVILEYFRQSCQHTKAVEMEAWIDYINPKQVKVNRLKAVWDIITASLTKINWKKIKAVIGKIAYICAIIIGALVGFGALIGIFGLVTALFGPISLLVLILCLVPSFIAWVRHSIRIWPILVGNILTLVYYMAGVIYVVQNASSINNNIILFLLFASTFGMWVGQLIWAMVSKVQNDGK